MTPIEYECDKIVSIRMCPADKFPWGEKPAFWYLKRPIYTMDAPDIGWSRQYINSLKRAGFDVAYWDGEKWWHHTPKQFATPEEAYEEWKNNVL